MSFKDICDGIARREEWCIKDDSTKSTTGYITSRAMWFTPLDHHKFTAIAFVYSYESLSTEEMFEKLCKAYMMEKKISSVEELVLKLAIEGHLR